MEDTATERHPIRGLFKFLLFVGALVAIGRVVATKKKEYYGLTESEARAKFESQFGPRIGEDKASEVADQVIPRLKDSGVIKPDPVEEAVDTARDMASDAADKAKKAATRAGDTLKDAAEEVKEKLD